MDRFFTGCFMPSQAKHLEAAFISIVRLVGRKSSFLVGDWILDSGAFSLIYKFGKYPDSPDVYAEQIKRWVGNGNMLAAVSQDYMCEPKMLQKTGLTISDHQRLTIERYDAIMAHDLGVYLMPVLQGYDPQDYVNHLRAYGTRLAPGAWVGVGSVCKRNGNPKSIEAVLLAIWDERPDLRLHGFGIKATALKSGIVDQLLYSSDSMAWSFQARMAGRDGNSYHEAIAYGEKIKTRQIQQPLFL